MARIVNLKHEPGAVARGAVRIDRRTAWGNPFVVGRDGTRDEVIARYRIELWRQIRSGEIALADLAAIAECDYACWCAPRRCHGEVLARAAAWAAGQLRARAAAAEPILFWSRCPEWGWLSNFAAAGFAGPGGCSGRASSTGTRPARPSTRRRPSASRAATPRRAAPRARRPLPRRLGRPKLARMAAGCCSASLAAPRTARLLATARRAPPRPRPGARTATPSGASAATARRQRLAGSGAIDAARRDDAPLDAAALARRVR